EIHDVIGEVSNIVGGSLKSRFCDSGLPCELSIPSITSGSDFHIESMNWARCERYIFGNKDHAGIVEVFIKKAVKT
ncbi:MAG TPA: chemotaxis protein CheX, partial [Desulfobacteraceae bacterium]|nr:chemotaxis protein CheX [Desulfobacteraceae bacterium]